MTLADALVRAMNDPDNADSWAAEGPARYREFAVPVPGLTPPDLAGLQACVNARRLGDAPAGTLLVAGWEWTSGRGGMLRVVEREHPWDRFYLDAAGEWVEARDAAGGSPYPAADFDAVRLGG
jgi:hypothetical protein